MDEVRAARGERINVVRRAFSSVPMDYRFNARAAVPGAQLAGTVEVRKSRWILLGTRTTLPLQASNAVSAGFWNTFVSVDVVPDVDAFITFERRRVRNLRVLLFVVLLIFALAASFIVAFRVY